MQEKRFTSCTRAFHLCVRTGIFHPQIVLRESKICGTRGVKINERNIISHVHPTT